MMASRLSVLNALSRYSTFSLVWVYGDATPLQVKQHLYKDEQSEPRSHHRATHRTPTLTLATSSSHKQNRVRPSHYINSQVLFRAPPPRVLPGSFPRYGSLLELLSPLHYSNLLLQCLSLDCQVQDKRTCIFYNSASSTVPDKRGIFKKFNK